MVLFYSSKGMLIVVVFFFLSLSLSISLSHRNVSFALSFFFSFRNEADASISHLTEQNGGGKEEIFSTLPLYLTITILIPTILLIRPRGSLL